MRRWLIILAIVLTLSVAAVAALRSCLPSYVRQRTVSTLRERFDSSVSFTAFKVSLFPRIKIEGEGMVLRHRGRTDIPPLIQIRKFSAETSLAELLQRPHHLSRVHLKGLQIVIPPRGERRKTPRRARKRFPVVVDEIIANNTELDILPKESGKPSRIFIIHHLVLHDAGLGRAMSFTAALTNPEPTGEIRTHGSFGPWQTDEPGLTPLDATYTFENANLATFQGIAGTLSSRGKFGGVLSRIEVTGETTTPDFKLSVGGKPVPLETQFQAIVDGTNGNTLLNPVRARIYRSSFAVRGGVFKVTGSAHREIVLDVKGLQNRLEDLLPLALKSGDPPMTGLISYAANLKVPPGKGDLVDRLKLNGSFSVSKARFTKLKVQGKVDVLSEKGLGQHHPVDQTVIASSLRGHFALLDGAMTFSKLTFSVPGASVRLKGMYNLHTEELDFRGTLGLRAEVSQLTTGWKSLLLKPLDPLFRRKRAGTVLPIRVTGTESDPSFRVEVGRALMRRDH